MKVGGKPSRSRERAPSTEFLLWNVNNAVMTPYPTHLLPVGYRRTFADVAAGSEPPALPDNYNAIFFQFQLTSLINGICEQLNAPWEPMLSFTAIFPRLARYLEFYLSVIGHFCETATPYDAAIASEDIALTTTDASNFKIQ